MQIEVRGPKSFLEQFRLHFHDQLEKTGYAKGPKVGYRETYIKQDAILSLQISEESEGRDCVFSVESEQDVPNLEKMWDNALISYGKELIRRLEEMAQNPEFVKKGLM